MQLILEQTAVYQEFSADFFVFILLWTYATTAIEEAAGLFFFLRLLLKAQMLYTLAV
jgi:hypothetical protein